MELNMDMNKNENILNDTTEIKVKTPKRIIHFSDGVIEEFSDDDNENNYNDNEYNEKKTIDKTIDESKMTWGPWMLHKTMQTGATVLSGCDYVGESIASFLGITTPKYSYEIETFKKMQEEHAEILKEDETTWITKNAELPSQERINAIITEEQQQNKNNKF